jgi:molecular chaperone DnaJ
MKENGIKNYRHVLFILNEYDPYKILGVSDDADLDVINKVYRDLAKKYHPDLFTHLPDKAAQKEIEQIFSKITAAFNKLKDPNARKRFDFEKRSRLKKIEAQNKLESSINLACTNPGKIKVSAQQKNLENEVNKRKTIEAESHFNLGFSLYKKNKFEEAMNNFNSAIMLEPKVAKYHSYLALVMMKKGWNGYANAEFKVALYHDPSDKIALENYNPLEDEKNTKSSKKGSILNNIASKFFKK